MTLPCCQTKICLQLVFQVWWWPYYDTPQPQMMKKCSKFTTLQNASGMTLRKRLNAYKMPQVWALKYLTLTFLFQWDWNVLKSFNAFHHKTSRPYFAFICPNNPPRRPLYCFSIRGVFLSDYKEKRRQKSNMARPLTDTYACILKIQ